MATVSVFDMEGKKVSETELNDAVFGITPNEAVMHACVVNYLANQRQGIQPSCNVLTMLKQMSVMRI